MPHGALPITESPSKELRTLPLTTRLYAYLRTSRLARLRRGRNFWTLTGVVAFVLLLFARHHATEFQYGTSTLRSYVPHSIAEAKAIYQHALVEDTRWDDDIEVNKTTLHKRPKFHLLIATSPTISKRNLCKTLFSAAILNYPPPTLINFGEDQTATKRGADVLKGTYKFLMGKEAHPDDLILLIQEDAWLQLPAEVTISRFFHSLQDSNTKLIEKYGKLSTKQETESRGENVSAFTQKVLFGAQKECSNDPSDPACYAIPASTLPLDIYGPETDHHAEGKYNRPRFMSSTTVIGHVFDLRPIYKHACRLLDSSKDENYGSQNVLSQIFGEQEYQRSRYLEEHPLPSWRNRMASEVASRFVRRSKSPPDEIILSEAPNKTSPHSRYEFGIGLDYASSIFQAMNNSDKDVRFVKFDHPSIIKSLSKLSASTFQNPIRLPLDLSITAPPFSQQKVSSTEPSPPLSALDELPTDDVTWSDVHLATNVIVPGSSVPSVLDFHGEEHLLDDMWDNMWFQKHARALLRQFIRSPDGPIAAEDAAQGGDSWWDLRGGKGGVWTSQGRWLEWIEVCKNFDEDVFRDGKGIFGLEDEEFGGQKPVFNSFGEIISGKARPDREKTQDVVEDDENLDDHEQKEDESAGDDRLNSDDSGGHSLGLERDITTTDEVEEVRELKGDKLKNPEDATPPLRPKPSKSSKPPQDKQAGGETEEEEGVAHESKDIKVNDSEDSTPPLIIGPKPAKPPRPPQEKHVEDETAGDMMIDRRRKPFQPSNPLPLLTPLKLPQENQGLAPAFPQPSAPIFKPKPKPKPKSPTERAFMDPWPIPPTMSWPPPSEEKREVDDTEVDDRDPWQIFPPLNPKPKPKPPMEKRIRGVVNDDILLSKPKPSKTSKLPTMKQIINEIEVDDLPTITFPSAGPIPVHSILPRDYHARSPRNIPVADGADDGTDIARSGDRPLLGPKPPTVREAVAKIDDNSIVALPISLSSKTPRVIQNEESAADIDVDSLIVDFLKAKSSESTNVPIGNTLEEKRGKPKPSRIPRPPREKSNIEADDRIGTLDGNEMRFSDIADAPVADIDGQPSAMVPSLPIPPPKPKPKPKPPGRSMRNA